MFKRIALLAAVLAATIALLGATGCTKKKMMGSLERPATHSTHIG